MKTGAVEKTLFDDDLNDEDLQQRIEEAINAPDADNHSHIHYGITIGDYHFLLETSIYCEVIDYKEPAKLPNTPNHFLGLCNLRGNLIPVYQFPDFQANNKKNNKRYIFIIDKKEKCAAIALSGLPQRCDLKGINQGALKATKLSLISDCSSACYEYAGKTWHLINTNKLFSLLATKPLPFSYELSE